MGLLFGFNRSADFFNDIIFLFEGKILKPSITLQNIRNFYKTGGAKDHYFNLFFLIEAFKFRFC